MTHFLDRFLNPYPYLVWGALWMVILFSASYPTEEFGGVVLIACLSWRVAQFIVNSILVFLLRLLLRYAEKASPVHHCAKEDADAESSTSLLAQFFVIGNALLLSGVMIHLTTTAMRLLRFPELGSDAITIASIANIFLGAAIVGGFLAYFFIRIVYVINKQLLTDTVSSSQNLISSILMLRTQEYYRYVIGSS